MKKKWIFSGIGILLFILLLFSINQLMNSRTYQLFGDLISQVETDQKVVALTFDDGPTNRNSDLLPLLEKYHAKATFFLIGADIEKYPDEAKKLVEAGHQIGNHTYSHDRMVFKTPSFIKKEIERTDRLIREAGYKGEIVFRPPYGKKLVGLPYYLKKHDRKTILWNLEPDSYFSSASDKIKYIKENMKPGSIILMHPWYGDSAEEFKAIEGILQELSNEGYEFVTVEELIAS
ncbi:polysaccharide deacetylase family protein [Neobacillus thermocopriae]|uniref:Polysaccharide deacetylase family protein n=1 Tax=Neobacillus thermocopriae TaxID=1215031 RepID=A0A6B3TQ58_9BACI|nr:polysaccharide deacetylase family protein [Neobacillus thermocopriae]MED3624696.1 polysaccharide deacetylase family protein [Neobacillus thermocopriae]MED3713154.1 polysaccharide deacetylase family protein [Neobacillus thermocopriae]NEX78470.1 polysaccharide deacetylase family protein [Neobacillus thermocopriae]